MLANIHATFKFRGQHWSMVKQYIINNTKYPKATGGTPITTWLPNQMGACLEQCQMLIKSVDQNKLSGEDKTEFIRIKTEVEDEIKRLFTEVSALQKDFDKQEVDQFSTRTKQVSK